MSLALTGRPRPRPSPTYPHRHGWVSSAAVIGAVAVIAGILGAKGYAIAVVALGVLAVLAAAPDAPRPAIFVVGAVLFGYIVADRLFAYLGLQFGPVPLYPGELAILAGLVGILPLANGAPAWRTGQGWIVGFVAWSSLLLLLFWTRNPALDSVRDFAFVYYMIFGVFAFVLPWERMSKRVLRLIALMFLLQFVYTAGILLNLIPPTVFGSFADLAGRADVEGANLLGGAAFFLLLGDQLDIPQPARIGLAVLQVGLTLLTTSRAVFLAVLVLILGIVFSRRGQSARRMVFVLVGGAMILGLLIAPGGGIETRSGVSGITPASAFDRLLAGFGIGGDDTSSNFLLQKAVGTTKWRLEFWSALIQHDAQRPDWLVVGRGFGPNLAVEAGLELPGSTVRTPHSIEMDVFARTGTIGFILWLGALWAVVAGARRVTRQRDPTAAVAHWLLVYWFCYLAVASFGVVLESPFGAAPFYFISGALLRLASLPPRRASDEGDGSTTVVSRTGSALSSWRGKAVGSARSTWR